MGMTIPEIWQALAGIFDIEGGAAVKLSVRSRRCRCLGVVPRFCMSFAVFAVTMFQFGGPARRFT
jgi:hypothetical protein